MKVCHFADELVRRAKIRASRFRRCIAPWASGGGRRFWEVRSIEVARNRTEVPVLLIAAFRRALEQGPAGDRMSPRSARSARRLSAHCRQEYSADVQAAR